VVSKDLQVIVEELEKLKGEVRIVYADIHVYKRIKRVLSEVKVVCFIIIVSLLSC